MPGWMMKAIGLNENDPIQVSYDQDENFTLARSCCILILSDYCAAVDNLMNSDKTLTKAASQYKMLRPLQILKLRVGQTVVLAGIVGLEPPNQSVLISHSRTNFYLVNNSPDKPLRDSIAQLIAPLTESYGCDLQLLEQCVRRNKMQGTAGVGDRLRRSIESALLQQSQSPEQDEGRVSNTLLTADNMTRFSKKYLLEDNLNIDKVVANINRVSEGKKTPGGVQAQRIQLQRRRKHNQHHSLNEQGPLDFRFLTQSFLSADDGSPDLRGVSHLAGLTSAVSKPSQNAQRRQVKSTAERRILRQAQLVPTPLAPCSPISVQSRQKATPLRQNQETPGRDLPNFESPRRRGPSAQERFSPLYERKTPSVVAPFSRG